MTKNCWHEIHTPIYSVIPIYICMPHVVPYSSPFVLIVAVFYVVRQMFHTDSWAKEVQDKEGSFSVAMTKSGHWVTRDQPDEVNSRIDAFLEI